MSVSTNFEFNTADQTSSLKLYVDLVLVTQYDYNAGQVTLSERINTDIVTLLQLNNNLYQINRWNDFLIQIFNPPNLSLQKFDEDMKKKNTEITGKYKYTNDLVSDVTYSDATKLVTFEPRSEITFSFSDFNNWRHFLNHFYLISYNF